MFDGKTSKLLNLGSNFNESLNIQSFSMSDKKVFFTAEKGTSLVSGAIDLATNIYKPIKTEDTFSLIAAY